MPFVDFDASRREVEADLEPLTMRIGGKDYEFPGAMPAEVGVQRIALKRLQREIPPGLEDDDQVPPELLARLTSINQAMARAVLGEHHDELEEQLSEWDFQDLIGQLVANWMMAQQDPTRLRRIVRRQRAQTVTPVTITQGPITSNGHSSSSTSSSRRTLSASTASTSPEPSSNAGSPGAASSRSSGGSRARP